MNIQKQHVPTITICPPKKPMNQCPVPRALLPSIPIAHHSQNAVSQNLDLVTDFITEEATGPSYPTMEVIDV